MAVNDVSSFYELEPYRMLKEILVREAGIDKEGVIENTIAYITAIVWFVHDGAQFLTKNAERQRRGIYRKMLKTIIFNLGNLGLDYDDIYLRLLGEAINFYIQDEECQTLQGLEKSCLEEIYKQKERIKIEERNAARR